MLEITSPSNPRIKLARKLQRRRAREQSGLCLLEGLRLVKDALAAGATFDSAFVARRLAEQAEQNPLLSALEKADVPLLVVDEGLLADISDTVTPQGIIALAHLPAPAIPHNPWLVLVLDGVGDPGNAGTLLRSAAAAGAELVIFGPETVDAFSPKVLRAGMGAHFRIGIRGCATWTETESFLGGERSLYVADAQAEIPYDAVDWRQPSALIVGSEAHGPSREAQTVATPIAIPMQGATESLNAAVAGSVILFEAARQRRFLIPGVERTISDLQTGAGPFPESSAPIGRL
ncbi:MAG: RNA methyltransferase [Chloroflexi bacterium]|nr:RNA methyltransferase [Chloroflexota bacterium]